MSFQKEAFDEWDPVARAGAEAPDEEPVKWTLRHANVPGHSYEDEIAKRLAEHTGSKQTYLTGEQEQELAAIVQEGLAAQPLLAKLEEKVGRAAQPLKRDLAKIETLRKSVANGREAEHVLIECNLRIATYLARLSMNIRPGTGQGSEDVESEDAVPRNAAPRRGPAKKHIIDSGHAWSPGDMTRYRSPFADYDERVQVVNEAIIKSVRNYRPGMVHTRGENIGKPVKFTAFAMAGLRGALARHITVREKPGIYVPVHRHEEMAQARRDNVMGHTPEYLEELSEWEKYSEPVFIEDVVSLGAADEELDAGGEEVSVLPLADVVADPDDISLPNLVAEKIRGDIVKEVLETLSEREAGVIRMRFGLSDGQSRTLDEIGDVYGITRERVRQIESKTMDKLRHHSRSHRLRDFVDLETELEAPLHTLPFPRLKTTRAVGGGVLRLSQDMPLGAGQVELASTQRERWQAYPDEEWDEPVRKTDEQLRQEFQEVATQFKEALFGAGVYTFQRSFVESGARSPYPKVLVESINQRFGNALTAHHIQQFWNSEAEGFINHLQERIGDDISLDRVTQLFSKLLAERMDDSTKLEITIPEVLNGTLNYFGAWLEHGELTVNGDLGNYAGYQMGGLGIIKVNGAVGDYAAAQARKMAHFEVMGSAGHYAAAQAQGQASLHVYGAVGDYCGYRARRDIDVQVLEDAGEHLAHQATGGNFVISGSVASTSPSQGFAGSISFSPNK